ncbi:endonuclease domain-containing protein [Brevundimonas intermedia]|uniref:endonuclease domain-containing protein n=1 Tax=Brevundimonas intermedia TaxID=74315 RepID=UPI00320A1F2F
MTRQERSDRARALRQTSGLAERRIWSLLRGGRCDGFKFRRQHPIDRYYADFACEALKLVIELDGGVHERDEVVLNDIIANWTSKRWDGSSYVSPMLRPWVNRIRSPMRSAIMRDG